MYVAFWYVTDQQTTAHCFTSRTPNLHWHPFYLSLDQSLFPHWLILCVSSKLPQAAQEDHL